MNSRLAPAKINLALHVTGRRSDGYHLLDSLVSFASLGDRVSVASAPDLSLEITGKFGEGIPVSDNLVMKAAACFTTRQGARIILEKNLPAASGIGGGSSDAAAVLRLLADLWQLELPAPATVLSLGADVPVCLLGQTARMKGIGEQIEEVAWMPAFDAVLVNPRVALSTAEVFAALAGKSQAALADMPESNRQDDWIRYLSLQRNDLEPAALSIRPVIGDVIAALEGSSGCRLARMSGSGATCFGLYGNQEHAAKAALAIEAAHPGWWVRQTCLG